MGKQHLIFLKDVFIKRFFVILLVGLICAAAAGLEKYYTKDIRLQTGNAVLIQKMQFQDPDEQENLYHAFDYKMFMKSPGNIKRFIDALAASDEVSMNVLHADWVRMDIVKKYDWLMKNMMISSFGDQKYEMMLVWDINTPKSVENFPVEAEAFANLFVSTTLSEVQKVKPNASVRVVSTDIIVPNVVAVSGKQIVLKYAVAGFLLGCILSMVAAFLLELRKR